MTFGGVSYQGPQDYTFAVLEGQLHGSVQGRPSGRSRSGRRLEDAEEVRLDGKTDVDHANVWEFGAPCTSYCDFNRVNGGTRTYGNCMGRTTPTMLETDGNCFCDFTCKVVKRSMPTTKGVHLGILHAFRALPEALGPTQGASTRTPGEHGRPDSPYTSL